MSKPISRHEDRLMLVLGATEQHGYLEPVYRYPNSPGAGGCGRQASGVLVAPPLNFGCSPYFLAYPGTFSLRVSTLMDAVEDLVRSAYETGFRRILVLNGHGGNSPARAHLRGSCQQPARDPTALVRLVDVPFR